RDFVGTRVGGHQVGAAVPVKVPGNNVPEAMLISFGAEIIVGAGPERGRVEVFERHAGADWFAGRQAERVIVVVAAELTEYCPAPGATVGRLERQERRP